MNQNVKASFYGALFAFCAAMLNASIGTFSKVLISHGLSPGIIALGKTLIGALILAIVMPFCKKRPIYAKWYVVAACAFFGIFIMFIFETKAYGFDTAANVVVALMASACVTTIVLGKLFLGEHIRAATVIGALLAILGLAVIVGTKFSFGFSPIGTILATCAGAGYGIFSIIMKKNGLVGGLMLTRQMLMYGSVFLLIPVGTELPVSFEINYAVIGCLIGLAVFPTIFGFYCTTKAIQYLAPSRVQIIELSEPIFAALIALIFLHEQPGLSTYVGGALILLGISIANDLFVSSVDRQSVISKGNPDT